MTIYPTISIPLKQHISELINNVTLRTSHMSKEQSDKLTSIISDCPNLFSDSDKKLTTVKGEIRTTTNDPIYSRSYPYPMALKKEVEKQINDLLKDGIIRPSKSPYNFPVWVVPKKKWMPLEKGNIAW